MVAADALSRRSDHSLSIENNNNNITLLPNNLFISLIDLDLQCVISDGYTTDTFAQCILSDPKSYPDWNRSLSDDVTTLDFRSCQYVPADLGLRRQILQLHHDSAVAGHPGVLATVASVSHSYYWPGLRSFVKSYVAGCLECQRFKINRHPARLALMPVPPADNLWLFSHSSMDFITDLPPAADGSDSILVVVDHSLSKGVILIPCKKKISALGTADLLMANLFKRFGLPDKLISDRDPRFASQVFQELMKALGIKSSMSTAFHPQSDRTTERFNQEIEAYLSIYCISNPTSWPAHLPVLEFVHNSRKHADRINTPFEIMFRYQPPALPTLFRETEIPELDERLRLLEEIRKEALAAHEIARERMYARIKSDFKPFTLGQKVWLEARNLKTMYNKKIKPKREGPFPIAEVLGPITYRLTLPRSWKIHDIFHAILLMLYKQTDVHGPTHPKPPPDLVEGQEEYEVDHIKRHCCIRGGKVRYLVHWKGYDNTKDTWEEEDNLEHAQEALQEYKQLHKIA